LDVLRKRGRSTKLIAPTIISNTSKGRESGDIAGDNDESESFPEAMIQVVADENDLYYQPSGGISRRNSSATDVNGGVEALWPLIFKVPAHTQTKLHHDARIKFSP
jgi:hypothetical protein